MIRELKTLVAVAREGTFAAAGQKIGLTQAAVSAQMQRLEGELGFELFDRSGRSARLNSISARAPLKSYRWPISLRAWFSALSTSCRSIVEVMSKELT